MNHFVMDGPGLESDAVAQWCDTLNRLLSHEGILLTYLASGQAGREPIGLVITIVDFRTEAVDYYSSWGRLLLLFAENLWHMERSHPLLCLTVSCPTQRTRELADVANQEDLYAGHEGLELNGAAIRRSIANLVQPLGSTRDLLPVWSFIYPEQGEDEFVRHLLRYQGAFYTTNRIVQKGKVWYLERLSNCTALEATVRRLSNDRTSRKARQNHVLYCLEEEPGTVDYGTRRPFFRCEIDKKLWATCWPIASR